MKKIQEKNKNRFYRAKRRRLLIALAELLGITSIFSLGLSAWVAEGGSDGTASGGIGVADVIVASPENLDVITITALNNYAYAAGYGFSNDGVFTNSTTITGTCLFNAAYGKRCFDSFVADNSFQLDIELTTALSGGFASQGFSSTDITLTSGNFPTTSSVPTSSDKITTTLTVNCNSNSANFTFDFSINLTYGSALTSFPNMASAALNVVFTPKENATI